MHFFALNCSTSTAFCTRPAHRSTIIIFVKAVRTGTRSERFECYDFSESVGCAIDENAAAVNICETARIERRKKKGLL
jgi:hypothetical protein